MELVPKEEKNSLVSHVNYKSSVEKNKRVPLEEEAYVSKIEKIIERDFFPDLKRLKLRKEYQEAVEKNNLEKLREVQIEWGKIMADYSGIPQETDNDKEESTSDDINVSLDKFLAKYTSEDNESFNQILEETKAKHRRKYFWLYEAQESARLMLEAQKEEENPSAINEGEKSSLMLCNVWNYTPKNALMYNPEGAPLSDQELIEASSRGKPTINHSQTRLPTNFYKGVDILSQAISQKSKCQAAIGHIGVDGNIELIKNQDSYSMIGTPSPCPGLNESPFMIWGEIGGTPLPVNTPGPSFRVPDTPPREALAFKLDSDNINKRKALKNKTQLIQKAKGGKTPLTPSQRFKYLSPAAQRLAARSGISTPTPLRVHASPRYTPVNLKSGSNTPSVNTPSRDSSLLNDSSLTDNLLKLDRNN